MPSLTDIVKDINITKVKHVASIAELQDLDLTNIEAVLVAGYHAGSTVGGGPFVRATGRHDGGTFIDITRPFPTDWNDQGQLTAWFADSGSDVVGLQRLETVWVLDTYFGAFVDSVKDDTYQIQALAKYIEKNSGGQVAFGRGPRLIGSYQVFDAGSDIINAMPVVNNTEGVFAVRNCTNPVVVFSNGAKFKWAGGTYFGTFNKNTKEPTTYEDPDATYGYAGNMLSFFNNNDVVISGSLELDGNIDNYIIGGNSQSDGIQMPGNGVRAYANKSFNAKNIYTHHHGLDGVMIGYAGLSSNHINYYPHTLENVRSMYNARQGLSWVGGNSLTATNCDFSFTGKNTKLATAPIGGIDIEPEGSVCINGTFINCRTHQNKGVGVLSSIGAEKPKNIRFIGHDSLAVSGDQASFWIDFLDKGQFIDCTFNGKGINAGDSIFTSCKLLMDPTLSSTGTIEGVYHDIDDAANFINCYMYAANGYQLPYAATATNTYNNCEFKQDGAGTFYTRGYFTGKNTLTYPSGTFDSTGSVYSHETTLNGVVPRLTTSPTQSEGTWIPTVNFGGSAAGISYAIRTGKWRKVGNQISLFADVQLSSKGTATGVMSLIGIPFVSDDLGNVSVSYATNFNTNAPTAGFVTSSTANLLYMSSTGNTYISDLNFNDNTRFAVEITVRV